MDIEKFGILATAGLLTVIHTHKPAKPASDGGEYMTVGLIYEQRPKDAVGGFGSTAPGQRDNRDYRRLGMQTYECEKGY